MASPSELQQENTALRTENVALKVRLAAVEAESAARKERIDELERRLGLNSSNSSKPPEILSSWPQAISAAPSQLAVTLRDLTAAPEPGQ